MLFIPYGTNESSVRRHFPYVNVLLVLINVLVFIVEFLALMSLGEAGFESFLARYSFVPASLSDNVFQVTLITSLFLHAGLLHIAGNMMYLLPFGDNVEDRLGHARYLLFYLICGVAANLVFAFFNPHTNVPLIGASGAIAGVLGGYIALHPTRSSVRGFLWIIIILIRVRLPSLLFIGYWFVMQLFSSVASLGSAARANSGGVAFLAHVGGFLTGLILAPLLAKPAPQTAKNSS
jgi:membrane associated rhomboid family serine protease